MKTLSTVLVALIVVMMAAVAASAQSPFEMTARVGWDAYPEEEYFHLYEIDGRVGLEPYFTWGGGWSLGPALVASAGVLHAGGEDSLIVGVGPRLELKFPDDRLTAFATFRPGVMTRHEFGEEDLGGVFIVSLDVGIHYAIGGRLILGYVYQHSSNAGIYDENPGVNFHSLQLGWRF
ncbi:MAG: acyloxyacyl hydrolase [Desulfobacterales bacterium]